MGDSRYCQAVTSNIAFFSAEILKILLRDESLADDVDLKQLAKQTESFSGSDLKRECLCPT